MVILWRGRSFRAQFQQPIAASRAGWLLKRSFLPSIFHSSELANFSRSSRLISPPSPSSPSPVSNSKSTSRPPCFGGFGVQGTGFTVQGSRFRAHGSGCRVKGLNAPTPLPLLTLSRLQLELLFCVSLGWRIQGSGLSKVPLYCEFQKIQTKDRMRFE